MRVMPTASTTAFKLRIRRLHSDSSTSCSAHTFSTLATHFFSSRLSAASSCASLRALALAVSRMGVPSGTGAIGGLETSWSELAQMTGSASLHSDDELVSLGRKLSRRAHARDGAGPRKRAEDDAVLV